MTSLFIVLETWGMFCIIACVLIWLLVFGVLFLWGWGCHDFCQLMIVNLLLTGCVGWKIRWPSWAVILHGWRHRRGDSQGRKDCEGVSILNKNWTVRSLLFLLSWKFWNQKNNLGDAGMPAAGYWFFEMKCWILNSRFNVLLQSLIRGIVLGTALPSPSFLLLFNKGKREAGHVYFTLVNLKNMKCDHLHFEITCESWLFILITLYFHLTFHSFA